VDLHPLRAGMMIYKQHSAYYMNYVGGNYIFDFQKKFVTIGVLARNCVAELNGKNIVLTDGDVVVTDGHDVTSIIDQKMRNVVFASMDPAHFMHSFLVHWESGNQVWICYPENGFHLPNQAQVFSTVNKVWGKRELPSVAHIGNGLIGAPSDSNQWDDDPAPWNGDKTIWNQQRYNPTQDGLLMARPAPSALLAVDTVSTADGVDIQADLEKVGIDLGDPEMVKTAVRVWPRITGIAGQPIYMRLGGQMWRDDPVKWGKAKLFEIGLTDHIDVFVTGRFLSYRLYSYTANEWTLHGFDIEYRKKGKF